MSSFTPSPRALAVIGSIAAFSAILAPLGLQAQRAATQAHLAAARGAWPDQATVTPTLPVSPTASLTPTATATFPITATATDAAPTSTGTPDDATPAGTATMPVTVTLTATPPATTTLTATATAPPTGTGTIPATATASVTRTPGPAPSPKGLPFASNGRWLDDENVATGIQVQNLDLSATANLHVQFVDGAGAVAMTVDRTAAPGGAPNFYLPTIFRGTTGLHDLFSAWLTADRPVGAIVRTDWFDSRGAAITTDPQTGDDIVVPVFVRRHDGFSSVVSIQNHAATPVTATVVAFAGPDGRTAAATTVLTIAPHAARHVFAGLDAAFQGLGDFDGWLRVRGGGALGVTSFAIADRSRGTPQAVAGFEGLPARSAAARLNVALFRTDQHGVRAADRLNTRIVVVNPGPLPAMVTLAYYGSTNPAAAAACRGSTFSQPAVLIAPGARHTFEQRPGGGHNVPADCFGTARIETASPDQRVVATVFDTTNADALLSAYSAVPADDAAARVALPLFRRNHVGLSTGIQVMNAGPVAATVHIDFSATDAASGASSPIEGCTVCDQTVPPNESFTWWPPAIGAIPNGTFGAAVVTASGPIVVLVNDYPTTTSGPATDPATYLGIGVP